MDSCIILYKIVSLWSKSWFKSTDLWVFYRNELIRVSNETNSCYGLRDPRSDPSVITPWVEQPALIDWGKDIFSPIDPIYPNPQRITYYVLLDYQ